MPRLYYATEYSNRKVGCDPSLTAEERETCINFSEAGNSFTINTHTPTIARGLIRAPYASVRELELLAEGDVVVGVTAELPIGCLSIHTPRKKHYLSMIISRVLVAGLHRERVGETQIAGVN